MTDRARGDRSISKLFSYVCPSCGGQMDTDEDRKLMVCRSCGNTYDYDYFGEENLLKAAGKALADGEYSTAKNMYSFMLDKEPSNIKALKGLLLAGNKVNKLYDITFMIKEGKFVPGCFSLDKYRNTNSPEAVKFFEDTDKVLSLYKEYLELKKAGKNLVAEEDKAERELDDSSGGSFFYYESDKGLKAKAIGAGVIIVILADLTLIFGLDYETPVWVVPVLAVAMVAAFIYLLSALLRMHANKKERKDSLMTELDSIDTAQDDNRHEMHRVLGEINAIFKEMNSY